MTPLTRGVLLAAAVLVTARSADAQSIESLPVSCWAVAIKGPVLVTKTDGTVEKGTLACLGTDQVVLASTGSIPLDSVRSIAKPRDGILDGVLKGASLGLMFVFGCGECDAGIVVRATLTYAAIGGAIDAAQGNNTTIYRRNERSSALGWQIRF